MAARLGRPSPSGEPRPAVLAVFGEHGNEHDVTTVAIGMLERLASLYGSDEQVTRLLDSRDLWVIPMMNPDGAEFDMSGRVPPLSWRKNRRPTVGHSNGVDLNRNWGKPWAAPVPEELVRFLADPDSDMYAGPEPFSENETRALRDFLAVHPEVRLFVDYHSGDAPFLQGGVLYPIPPDGFADARVREVFESLADGFARAMTSHADSRHAFVAIRDRDVAPTLRNLAPDDIRDSIPEHIPAAPGTSLEFVYGDQGRPALGVEIMRNSDFFDTLPECLTAVIESQCRGVVYLLDALGNLSL
jgi:murein tripeptide amidase MpaA